MPLSLQEDKCVTSDCFNVTPLAVLIIGRSRERSDIPCNCRSNRRRLFGLRLKEGHNKVHNLAMCANMSPLTVTTYCESVQMSVTCVLRATCTASILFANCVGKFKQCNTALKDLTWAPFGIIALTAWFNDTIQVRIEPALTTMNRWMHEGSFWCLACTIPKHYTVKPYFFAKGA